MSLQALSTELDVKIIKHLHRNDLSHLTLVSKYYRSIGEPYLYRTITLGDNEDDRIKQLLVTLLLRKDLRQLVDHMILQPSHTTQPFPLPRQDSNIFLPGYSRGSRVHVSLWSHVTKVKEFIDELAVRYSLEARFRMALFTKVFEPFPLFDGAFALMLCMMPNIRVLRLVLSFDHDLPMTQEILAVANWGPSEEEEEEDEDEDDQHRPFHKLSSLYFDSDKWEPSEYPVSIRPGLGLLAVHGNRECQHLGFPRVPSATTNVLRVLTLNLTNIDPQTILDAISSSWMQNLESFEVYGLGLIKGYSESPWLGFDYELFKEAMRKHLPRLSKFVWIAMGGKRTRAHVTPFGSFAKFKQLKRLSIDYDLFIPKDDQSHPETMDLAYVQNSLPPQYELFELASIKPEAIDGVAKSCLENNEAQQASEVIQRFAASFASEGSLSMTLETTHQDRGFLLNQPTRSTLRSATFVIDRLGIVFTIRSALGDPGSLH